jgi:hypothetical protein
MTEARSTSFASRFNRVWWAAQPVVVSSMLLGLLHDQGPWWVVFALTLFIYTVSLAWRFYQRSAGWNLP